MLFLDNPWTCNNLLTFGNGGAAWKSYHDMSVLEGFKCEMLLEVSLDGYRIVEDYKVGGQGMMQ